MLGVEITFWLSALIVAYVIVGYPLLALVWARLSGRVVVRDAITPKLSLIIAAYNEESAIAKKIEESLALDYPRDRLEIIVADDGSTDRTPDIVRDFEDPRVLLHRSEGRGGKTITLNGAAAAASGEILVFSDATGVFSPGSLRQLASNFADPTVGCVSGRVAYDYGDDPTSRGFRVYQRFVVAVRQAEASFGSLTSVSGAIHAVRADLFRPSEPAFTQDLADVIHTVAQGYRVVYDSEAVALEKSRERFRDEFASRVRISIRENSMVPFMIGTILRTRRVLFLFQLISSKLLRWWLWAFLCAALLTNLALALHGPVYAGLALVQSLFYAQAVLALLLERTSVRIPGSASSAFFVATNTAMCVGFFRHVFVGGMKSWEPIR